MLRSGIFKCTPSVMTRLVLSSLNVDTFSFRPSFPFSIELSFSRELVRQEHCMAERNVVSRYGNAKKVAHLVHSFWYVRVLVINPSTF